MTDIGSAEPRPAMQTQDTPGSQNYVRLLSVCVPVPFAKFDYDYTRGSLSWSPNKGQDHLPHVTVPNGFCTDLTSVPRLFWSVFPKTGKYAYAAIIHDYLYWTQAVQRSQADEILKIAMDDSNVGAATSNVMYYMVRGAGSLAWTNNAKLKLKGERRMLKVFPSDGESVTWAHWRSRPEHFSE
jgi:hypothetical protein